MREAPAPAKAGHAIVGEILDSMADGVIVVGRGGEVRTWNAAAAQILDTEAAPGAGFAETLVAREGLDALSQTVLDAVQGGARGERRNIEVTTGDGARTLEVTTTHLRAGGEDAVVAVFSDVTETERLGAQVRAQLAELGAAYRTVEARNEALAAAARKARTARWIGAAAGAALIAGTAAWAWRSETGLERWLHRSTEAHAAPAPERTWRARTSRLRLTTTLAGTIVAGATSDVTSSAQGTVRTVSAREGDHVEAGSVLATLDVAETERALRSARARAGEAAERLETLRHWTSGREMRAAERAVRYAAEALERAARERTETEALLSEGVIARDEHEAALERVRRRSEDLEAARAEREAVRAQGAPAVRARAEGAWRNAAEEVEALERAVAGAVVRAPATGMVLHARARGERARSEQAGLTPGMRVSSGQVLAQIAHAGTLAVEGHVSEVEVARLHAGQKVEITGDAFPEITLEGHLTQIAPRAEAGAGGGRFTVRAEIAALGARARAGIRLGMSAQMTVVLRDEPQALIAPVEALRGSAGRYTVARRRGGAVETVEVEIGASTPQGVEIVRGLDAGDTVVLR